MCRLIAAMLVVLSLSGCAWLREPARPPSDGPYAEGARALVDNRIDAALDAWRRYLQAAPPDSPQAQQVRGYITLLEREAARRLARQLAAGERQLASGPRDRLHVAVFPFAGAGSNGAPSPHSRALVALLSADLAQVPAITLLEREHIDALLREQRLIGSGLVDSGAVVQQARLMGAGSAIGGVVFNAPGPAGPGSGPYKINTAITGVADGRVVGTQEAEGLQADFFRLEKEIVLGILKSLEIDDIPPAVNAVHTRSWEAYSRFAAGLAALAEDRFDEARAAFRAALNADPGFALAGQALQAVPAQGATLESVRAELGARR